jgi:tetratricopeptide (TPR) repeat protein
MARPPDGCRLTAACLLLLAVLAACSSKSQGLLEQAETSWRKGNYEEAIQTNLELYQRDGRGKHAARALLNVGNIYYLNLRQLKDAIDNYNRLTLEFPDTPEALQARRQLASIYTNEEVIRDLDQAIAQYDRLLESGDLPDRMEIEFQRADAFFKKGENDRALRSLNSLEEAGVSGRLAAQVSLKIGDIYLVERRFSDAVGPYRKVLDSDCQECRQRAIMSLAESYENLLDVDNAIATVRLLDKNPANEQFISREVERLTRKRREMERTVTLGWPQPKPAPPAKKSAVPPAKKKH